VDGTEVEEADGEAGAVDEVVGGEVAVGPEVGEAGRGRRGEGVRDGR
jgi:hypothetical protein